jgi:hypothetical protein
MLLDLTSRGLARVRRDLDGLDLVSAVVDPDLHALVHLIVSRSEQ